MFELIRPWYRSRLFWGGIFVFSCLLSIWRLMPVQWVSSQVGPYSFNVIIFPDMVEVTMSSTNRRGLIFEVVPLHEDFPRLDPDRHFFKWGTHVAAGGKGPSKLYYISMRTWVPLVAYAVAWAVAMCGWQAFKVRKAREFQNPSLQFPE